MLAFKLEQGAMSQGSHKIVKQRNSLSYSLQKDHSPGDSLTLAQ